MERKLGIKITFSKTTPYVTNITINENKAVVDVYEWINFDWESEDKNLNSSGMGINHQIILSKDNGNWSIQKDSYDEGPLSEVTTPDIIIEDKYEKNKDKEKLRLQESKPSDNVTTNYIPGHYITYDRVGAKSYADRYVKYGASGSIYDGYYNTAYKNFNSSGGDCANYVSQSLYEGGKLPMVGLASNFNGTGAWWYSKKGTSTTTDDTVSTNWAWTGAHYNRSNIAYDYGTIVDNPTNSDIIQGNPVYYDWDGKYASSRWYNHTTICVGKDASGVPLVNSHNNDYYHVRWNYGGSNTGYSTVKIKDSIFIAD